ncbi:hypothetical protein [Streptomyces sp. SM12]|uniref:hypothetical protein n=1 Tax=Streptomyces sp. SM12 TaxID=1071602 RepID=UPI0011B0A4B4|nr:hypothetical protein [Streptomyces sp. SM12]
MTVRSTVETFPAVRALEGLDQAWFWSPAPGLNFYGAATADGSRLFQLHTRDHADDAFAVALLAHARRHEDELTGEAAVASTVEWQAPAGYGFDTLASLPPEVHQHYEYEDKAFNAQVFVVYGGYRCEFPDALTMDEFLARERMVDWSVAPRDPAPFLRMRYANPRTGSSSVGSERGVATEAVLLQELQLLDGVEGAFVEFENYRRQVQHVRWDHGLSLTEDGRTSTLTGDELTAHVKAALYGA